MWYFCWILGVLLACSLGIINVLRLEAQEALDKEHVAVDPLTHLLARESVLVRLQEKVDNSHRNKMPFSLLYLSLTDFKCKHQLPDHEMDTTLLKVVDAIKHEIRENLDIAARFDEEGFLLALPGVSLNRAEAYAGRIKSNIASNVKTPGGIPVDIHVGIAEYSDHAESISTEISKGMGEVEALLNIAMNNCFAPSMT